MGALRNNWYTTSQVADILGRSDRFVRDRVKSGELDAMANKGKQRTSYKISAQALASYLLLSRKQNPDETQSLLQDLDLAYLEQLHASLEEEILRRMDSRVEIVPKCRAGLRPLMELEAKRYEELFVPEDIAVYEKFYDNPTHMTSGALNRESGKLEGHLSVGVTTVEFYESICKSQVDDDKQAVWAKGKTPILYINSFILDDPVWAIFLFKDMAEQIAEFERQHKIEVGKAFAVAAQDNSRDMLSRYGFDQVASYRGKYAVMLNRDIRAGRMGRFLRS